MIKPTHFLLEVNPHRYKVKANVLTCQFDLCEIALYVPINKWYLVKDNLNYELSEQALRFIYENVKRLNGESA